MKWNKYQLLVYFCYLCAFNCFFSALFFPQLLQSLNPNSTRMVKSAGLIQDVNCTKLTQQKSELPKPIKGIPASKRIDNRIEYDITIVE